MSSDEDAGEAFEVSQYDIDNEFNPNRGRRKRSKDEALYGVFNEDINGQDDREEQSSKRNRQSKPMSFVSAKQAAAEAAGRDSSDDEHDAAAADSGASPSDQVDARPSFGSGSSSGGGLGFGFMPGRMGAGAGNRPAFGMGGNLGGGGGGGGGLGYGSKPSGGAEVGNAAEAPVMKKASVPTSDPFAVAGDDAAASKPKPVAYGMRAANMKQDKDWAKWTKSTSGFGLKMLKKMGYKEGAGLGVSGNGILNPVKSANINRSRVKLGIQDSGERTEQSKADFGQKETEEMKKEAAFREQLAAWKQPGKAKVKKQKYKYATVGEIAERAQAGGSRLGSEAGPASAVKTSTMKVVDMTGATARVFSGYDKISNSGGGSSAAGGTDGSLPLLKGADGSVPMPELQNNINLLVSQAEGDITDISAKIKREKNRGSILERERGTLQTRVAKEATHIATLKAILTVIADCRERLGSKSNPIGLAGCADTFAKLKRDHPREYSVYGLAGISGSIMFPMIKSEFEGWLAVKDPFGRLDFFKTCRMLLSTEVDYADGGGAVAGSEETSMFEKVCWDVVMPRFRAGLLNDWDPKDPSAAVSLVEAWESLLPSAVMDNVVTQLVLPRLSSAVDVWDPRSDPDPVHLWLHPWLPLLGDALNALYGPIRYKLATCLQAWHPSDTSAKTIIEPWRTVWSQQELTSFLQRSVQPKLTATLDELPIDPGQQNIAPFRWVVTWRGLIPANAMVRMLDQHFFPKLLAVLCSWLSGSKANFPEIARWYIGWKQELNEEIASHPIVTKQLDLALDLMSKALAGGGKGTSAAGVPRASAAASALPKRKNARAAPDSDYDGLPPAQTFKDLVQRVADKVGVVYMPKDGMGSNGKKLYSFGKLSIYIEQGVAFGRETKSDAFLPMSLEELGRRAI